MNSTELWSGFDVRYNNITSNQAPGLNAHEISLFLTQAEYEVTKNYFTANSRGNTLGQGFDDSAKRQADFSSLMMTKTGGTASSATKIDRRSQLFTFPTDAFIVINEVYQVNGTMLQVLPLRYDEYTRLMSKPFKRPLKYQAWRLINSGAAENKVVEIIAGPGTDSMRGTYTVRYVRKPKPIIVGDLDGLTIDGYEFGTGTGRVDGCELDSILHEDILQRAVELAKIAWTATGQDNTQVMLQAGQRSE